MEENSRRSRKRNGDATAVDSGSWRGIDMVMIFRCRKVLNFLLKRGEVVIFRLHKRKEGKDWITHKRGGKKIAEVEIVLLEEIENPSWHATKFQKYVDKSGFDSVKEWWDAIIELNGFSRFMNAKRGYFYLVRGRGDEDGLTVLQ